MPQENQNPWADLLDKPKAVAPADQGPPKDSGNPWSGLAGKSSQPAAASTAAPPKDQSSILTRSLISDFTGKSASEWFQSSGIKKHIENMIPEEWRKEHGDFVGQYLANLSEIAPGALDWFSSPPGILVVGAHLNPSTRGIAAVSDMFLTAWQGSSALKAIDKFYKSHSPEDAAEATAALFFTYAGRKAFMKTEGAISAGAKGEPIFKDTIPLREDIISQPTTEDKIVALDKANQPANNNYWKKQASKMYSIPLVDQIATMAQVPKTELGDVSQELVRDWAENRASTNLKITQFLTPFRHTVPESESTVFTVEPDGTLKSTKGIHSVIESKTDPKVTSLSPEGQQAVTAIRKTTNDFKEHIIKEHEDPDIEKKLMDADEYVRHFWDFGDGDEETPRTSGARRALRDRFLQGKRVIDTIDEGLEISNRLFRQDPTAPRMKPRYNNIFDIKAEEFKHSAHVIENQKFYNIIKAMGAILPEDQHEDLGLDWPKSESPQLKALTYVGKKVSQKPAAERTKARRFRGEPMTTVTTEKEYRPVRIYPGVKMAVDAIFGSPITRRTEWIGPPVAALQQLSSFGKTVKLGLSLFHQNTLATVGFAMQVTRGGAEIGKPNSVVRGVGKAFKQIYLTNPEWWRGNKAAFFELAGKPTSMSDEPRQIRTIGSEVAYPVSMGLNLRTEENLAATRSSLIKFGRDTKYGNILGAPIRLFGYLNYMLQKPLWDYYHPSVMLDAFHTIYADELNHLGKDATREQMDNLGRAVADHVNNVMAAVDYDKLLVHPITRQVLGIGFLAPGWTMSIGRTVAQGFEGVTQARLARHYYGAAFLTWLLANQAFNMISTSWNGDKDKDGKTGGHFTWDNAGLPIKVLGRDTGFTDNFFNIQAGRNPNGTERFIELGKPYRELADWFIDPRQTAENKLNPWIKALEMAWWGIDPQTDFKVRDKDADDFTQALQTVGILVDPAVPMSLDGVIKMSEHKAFPEVFPAQMTRGSLLGSTITGIAGIPTKSGESSTKLKSAFIRAMDAGDTHAAIAVLVLADRNNISRASIAKAYKDEVRVRLLRKLPPRQYDDKGNRIQ